MTRDGVVGTGVVRTDVEFFLLDLFPQTPLQFSLPSKCSRYLLVDAWNHWRSQPHLSVHHQVEKSGLVEDLGKVQPRSVLTT